MVNETSRSRPPSFFFDQTLIDGNKILSRRDWTSKQLHRKILWNLKREGSTVSEFFFHFNFIYLFFKSLTHGIEDERVDSGVNVAHRVSNNLIKMNIWIFWLLALQNTLSLVCLSENQRKMTGLFFHKFALDKWDTLWQALSQHGNIFQLLGSFAWEKLNHTLFPNFCRR